mmetsp:Transcript_26933/g.67838  ORF Transcript_26933/g.67838 Transcript_26933/m.67838 type:complete len:421 (+) Transcript_26933:118-1380(+)
MVSAAALSSAPAPALWSDPRYRALLTRPTGRQRLTQALQREMVKDVTERIVFSGSRGHQKNQVAEDGGLSVVEWLRGIGLEHDRDLIRRAAIEYDNKMAFLLQDEFHPTDFYSTGWQNLLVTPDDPEPVLVDDKEQNGALATAEDQQETTQAAGSFAADKLAVVAGANPGMRTTRTSLGYLVQSPRRGGTATGGRGGPTSQQQQAGGSASSSGTRESARQEENAIPPADHRSDRRTTRTAIGFFERDGATTSSSSSTTPAAASAANAAEGAKSTQHDTHDNAAIRVRVLRALELIRRNGLAAEATRIRLNRKLQEIEKSLTLLYGTGCVGGARKSMKVGRNYLGGGGSRLRTNPIQEWLEGIDERMASKYVRILSRTFAYLEDVDETAVFWLEQAGCKVLAWERMALLKAIKDMRAAARN